jgi:hypothetical protein
VLGYAASIEPTFALPLVAIGGVGAVLLALVLLRRLDGLLPWAIVPLGITYTAALATHGSGVDGRAPLVAVAMLVCAELAAWSLDEYHPIAADRDVVTARAGALGALAAASLAASGLSVALSLAPGSGLGWTVLGAAASVLVVAVAVRLALRASS